MGLKIQKSAKNKATSLYSKLLYYLLVDDNSMLYVSLHLKSQIILRNSNNSNKYSSTYNFEKNQTLLIFKSIYPYISKTVIIVHKSMLNIYDTTQTKQLF